MRRKRRAIIAICAISFAVVFPFSFVRETSAFHEPDLLTLSIKATAIKGESIDEVLGHLAAEYRIPIGIELGDSKLIPSRKIDFDLPETNLKVFLDSLIAKDTRYTWKLEQGVIHLWPASGRDPLIATLLDTKISHFAIIGGSSKYAVYNDIMDLPEIRSQLIIAGVEPMIFLSSGSMTKVGKDTMFAESSLTLKELLDKIVVKTEINRWVITRWGENNEFITLRS